MKMGDIKILDSEIIFGFSLYSAYTIDKDIEFAKQILNTVMKGKTK